MEQRKDLIRLGLLVAVVGGGQEKIGHGEVLAEGRAQRAPVEGADIHGNPESEGRVPHDR